MNPLVVTAIAFGASLLGALSGGSSSMITTPAWVALGATFPAAVAADKIAGTFWTTAAARTYLVGAKADRKLLFPMGAAGLLGAGVGALMATSFDKHLLRRGAGGLILGVLTLSLVRGSHPPEPRRAPRGLVALFGFPLGLYEGILGSGNAILTSLLLQRTRGWNLILALGHYYALAALWCALAAVVYLGRGGFNPALAFWATVGSLLGGTLGANLGRSKGPAFVKPLFVVAGALLAVSLLLTS